MHETTQRRICRVAFLALCVTPTLLLTGWVVSRCVPGRHDAVLASLGRQLGCRVSIDRITTPTPEEHRLVGVTFADPTTGETLATIDWFECRISSDRLLGNGGELCINDPTALANGCVGKLLQGDWPTRVRARFDHLTLADSSAPTAWDSVEASISSQPSSGRRLEIKPRSGGAHLLAERSHADPSSSTRIEFATGGQPVAWSWLVGAPPNASRFNGRLVRDTTADHSETELTGLLTDFDPAALLGQDNGLALNGSLQVEIGKLWLVDGRIEELLGEVSANGGGAIEHRVLWSAMQRLGCQPTPELRRRWPLTNPLSFDHLAFAVRLDDEGCRIAGRTHGVLASAGEALLLAPSAERLPLESLLHFVAPDAERYHPATPEAIELARRLPLAGAYR